MEIKLAEKIDILKSINIGHRVAEEEINNLEKYFVETVQWEKLRDNEIDVVYGAKGTGKSALYGLLVRRESDFKNKGISLVSAENVLGAPVFASLKTDAIPSESSFKFLWKMYCLVITVKFIREKNISGAGASELVKALETIGLLPAVITSTPSLFKSVTKFVKSFMRSAPTTSQEWTIGMDPVSGLPIASYKRELGVETEDQRIDDVPVDDLLAKANALLSTNQQYLWILFDRLDIAFADSEELERTGLRSLFRTYNDMKPFDNIKLKIFVRDDIWLRVSSGGFSEASHIIKSKTIEWDSKSLLDLLVLRLVNNKVLLDFLGLNEAEVKESFDSKKSVLTTIFPDKVDSGKNLATFDWIISRIQDGLGNAAPRELIHFMESIIALQIDRLNRSEPAPPGKQLFDRIVFKQALKAVSATRYSQTLVPEYAQLEKYMKPLENGKAEQSPSSLKNYWGVEIEEVEDIAEKLCRVGFFKKVYKKKVMWFHVPYLYRSCLALSQGKSAP